MRRFLIAALLALSVGQPVHALSLMKPRLYAFVVGVSDYDDPRLKLSSAAQDARDFADALKTQDGNLYGAVETRVVTNRDVTRTALVEGLDWLEKEVTSRDVAVLFLAGHSLMDARQNYRFLSRDFSPDRMRDTTLTQEDVRGSLGAVAGKALLFLDACHDAPALTGGAQVRCFPRVHLREFDRPSDGVVIFLASGPGDLPLAPVATGPGAFTKALVEGIAEGKADLLGRGTITLTQLEAFVANRVKELTNGRQHPSMMRPPTVPDYPIASLR